jgi:DNA-binding HxlR family transcriptional regulator
MQQDRDRHEEDRNEHHWKDAHKLVRRLDGKRLESRRRGDKPGRDRDDKIEDAEDVPGGDEVCVLTRGARKAKRDAGSPVARALDVIGEKWSLLILRELLRKGPQRFQEFESGLPGVAPNTLSARLKALENQCVIGTRLYESHPPRYEYFLTDKDKALGPVLKALYGWGERHG